MAMTFRTEEGMQQLANKKGRAVCGWIPCVSGQPIVGGAFKWVYDPSGKVREYEGGSGQHSIKRVFRPAKGGDKHGR